jgi:hypothetical protein
VTSEKIYRYGFRKCDEASFGKIETIKAESYLKLLFSLAAE